MGKTKKANKEALEFVVVNRGMDDPNFNNPNAPSKVLLHVPKDYVDDSIKQNHDKLLKQIPEISRGIYNEDAIEAKLKEMGVNFEDGAMDKDELLQSIDNMHKDNMIKKVKMDMTKNEMIRFEKGSRIVPVEEDIDTFEKSKLPLDINNLDDKKVDELLKRSKIDAKFVEYNEFGLPTDVHPEVLEYVTNKEFVEGVDVYIPAPNMTYENRFDIDIPVEEMDDEYKEVYNALNADDDDGDELEDDFIFLANEGEAPVKIDDTKQYVEQVVQPQQNKQVKNNNNEPSYKFITKEEKEFLDKKFSSTYDKYYKNSDEPKIKYASKEEFNDAINELTGGGGKKDDEEEFEEFEDYEDFEDIEEDDAKELIDNDEAENVEDDDNERGEYKNNIKIEYMGTKKKDPKKKKDFGENVHGEIDKIIHDKNYIEKTIELFENKPEVDENDEEGYQQFYVTKKLDITSVTGTFGNLPKSIAYDKPYKPKKAPKEDKDDQITTKVIASYNPIDITNEEKNDKKLRKKLVKEEKREKRVQKKSLKKAFAVIYNLI